ncbi:MAG TPA: hypothetical protein VK590_13795 [Saprospiraceae bacterium]|nr:hypothetical protein [Saprospiraceae bacterium]
MARQSSLIKLEGSVGDLTFVKTKRGYFVRKKASMSKARIQTDPNFQRTRENIAEFGNVAQAGGVLRKSLRTAVLDVQDANAANRLFSILTAVKNQDATHDRGLRTVAAGIADAPGQAILNGFDFNDGANLDSILLKDFTLDTDDGVLTITGLKPSTDLLKPLAAHKAGFNLFWTKVDFAHGISNTVQATESLIALDDAPHNITLTIPAPPTGTGINIFAVRLVYYQTLNGENYIFNDETRSCAKIVAVV